MRELPQFINEGFYMWFNQQEKEEYYSTPLFLYGVKREEKEKDETRLYLKLEKNIFGKRKNKYDNEIRKQPSTIYIHYAEPFGMFLMRFLNADLSSYESAYTTFFFAYGFELIKEYAPYTYLNIQEPLSKEQFLHILKDIYETSVDKLLEMQQQFRKAVDFIYNLNNNNETIEGSTYSKFIAYVIKNDLYSYSQDIEIILDNYIKKHHEYQYENIQELIKRIDNKDSKLELRNVYTSDKLSNICFIVLEQIAKESNMQIKTCQNCGKYFIPTYRLSEIYCDFENADGTPTCKDKGANQTYKKKLENSPVLALYRKIYHTKYVYVKRHKKDKEIEKEFENWRKQAKDKIAKLNKNELTEEELNKWLTDNQ